MRPMLLRIVVAILAISSALLTGARLFAELVGYSAVPEDTQMAIGLVRELVAYLLGIPWWALFGLTTILVAATLYVFRLTYSKEVVIRSDTHIVDVRSSRELVMDCDRGRSFLFRPVDDTLVVAPINPQEGVYRLFVLNGPDQRTIEFDGSFEPVSGTQPKASLANNRMFEFQVVIVRDGRGYRHFVTDTAAFLRAVAEAETSSRAYALAFGGR